MTRDTKMHKHDKIVLTGCILAVLACVLLVLSGVLR